MPSEITPLVSVIIPAFGAEASLARALRSALAGGLPEAQIELLVEVDDGADYSAHAALSPAVRIADTGLRASGAGPARNRAMQRARGEWVTFLDADDHIAPGALADLLRVARAEGAGAAPLVIEDPAGEVLRLWQDQERIGFADLAESGASLRIMLARGQGGDFSAELAQDIDHALRVMARQGGSLPLSRLPWHLCLNGDSVTAAGDFSARVLQAYHQHIAALEADASLPPLFALAAADVFRAKLALNAGYTAEGAGRSYYRYIADLLAGQGAVAA